ncbi:MAG TPA: SRPBCC domain-containing protein [Cyclobacteriaceae bacterium]|nr:SRPBCC domain-containing protein [Cyclobacteriaceae bacterium]
MKNNLFFDFTVDKTANTVFVTREFAAELSLVWDAFTKQEILDQWWAPKPWLSRTKYMNFNVGGRRFYAMCGPEGQEHWAIQDFTAILPKTNFKFIDAFSDKDENINTELPSSEWNLDFKKTKEVTKVFITVKHKTLADLEQIIQMGFKEGFTMTLNDLDQLLNVISQKARRES